MKIAAIVQARMGSTRLPGKVMVRLEDKTVLGHVIERVKQAKLIDEIIIATSENSSDSIIEMEAKKNGASIYRGSEKDVLKRYYNAAIQNNANIVVRITSDCPLIDPIIIDKIIGFFLNSNYDIVTNVGADVKQRTFPRGLDIEVFTMSVLKDAYLNGHESYHREHVTPYIYEQKNNKIYYYKNEKDLSQYRWTLDTEDDLNLIKQIYKRLYNTNHNFYMNEIVNLFEEEPELYNINKHVEQKKIK